jgi:protein ImuA
MAAGERSKIMEALQAEILRLQGYMPSKSIKSDLGLGSMNIAFPGGTFPVGAVHEFLTTLPEDVAATNGFMTGLLSFLMGSSGTALWISSSRTVFPPALKHFGVQPDRIVFIDLPHQKDILWVMEEALKCSALTAVVGDLKELSFTASRRLQLAVEKSKVTGFILRQGSKPGTTACVSRWKITSLPGELVDDLPGVGYPSWRADLLRIRNGKPGVWEVVWANGTFKVCRLAETKPQKHTQEFSTDLSQKRKAG